MYCKDELNLELRRYKLDDLLLILAKRSQDMYMKGEAIQETRFSKKIGGRVLFSEPILLPAWGLAELSWRAINSSNDCRSCIAKPDDIVKLNNLLAKVSDEKGKGTHDSKSPEEIRFHIFHGLSQTQFWWQNLVRTRRTLVYDFLRYYLMLNEMPKYFPKLKQPNEDLLEITGFTIEDFSKLLFASYAWATTIGPEVDFEKYPIDKELTERNPLITRENLTKCIGFFAETYDYYRQDTHIYNPIFFKPIVETQTKRFIITNTFIWARKFYEGIYWLVRDKYRVQDDRFFTAAFGKYYEKYIEELLKYYLKPGEFKRIIDGGNADWLIYTDKYLLIVEQKSSLMSIGLKTEYPSVEKLEEYMGNFGKACIQLENTREAVKHDKRMKVNLILHFEKLYFRDAAFKKMVERLCGVSLKGYYFIDTEEFERLMQILSYKREAFDKIIEEKMAYEDNPPPAEGLDFESIMNKIHGWEEIKFLEQYNYIFDTITLGK